MFIDFLNKLSPVHESNKIEWGEFMEEYEKEFSMHEPHLFWYPSSGFDLKALNYFDEKHTSDNILTPTIDFFVYSDYNPNLPEKFETYYKNFDEDDIRFDLKNGESFNLFKKHGDTELKQVIPLYFLFNTGTIEDISQKYRSDKNRSYEGRNTPIASDVIYYLKLDRESVDSGDEYFPLFFIAMDNWLILEEIWKPLGIKFDYLCSVCDGCKKGGAYWCVNELYKDFLPVLNQESYWITDHHRPMEKPDLFSFMRNFNEWGCSNADKTGQLFKVDNK